MRPALFSFHSGGAGLRAPRHLGSSRLRPLVSAIARARPAGPVVNILGRETMAHRRTERTVRARPMALQLRPAGRVLPRYCLVCRPAPEKFSCQPYLRRLCSARPCSPRRPWSRLRRSATRPSFSRSCWPPASSGPGRSSRASSWRRWRIISWPRWWANRRPPSWMVAGSATSSPPASSSWRAGR